MKHSQSLRWHQDIAQAAANFRPHEFTIPNSARVSRVCFPLAQLRAHTDAYLKRKGNLGPVDRDRRLISLVRDHGKKDVAITACAHALSTPALRKLIGDCLVDPVFNHDGLMPYLHSIIGAHYANPTAVSRAEALMAQVLVLLSSETAAVGRCLDAYFSASLKIESSDLFSYPFVEVILSRASAKLGERLDGMRRGGQWKRAYQESAWLSGLLRDNPAAAQLLSGSFSSWLAWAFWRPNVHRLDQWERFTAEQRDALRDILALEGPDFKTGDKLTLREGLACFDANQPYLTIRYETLTVKLKESTADSTESQAAAIFNRLLDFLDTALAMPPSAIALFIHLCARNPIDGEVFQFLELINSSTSHHVSMAVIDILTAGEYDKVRAAMQLIPSLKDGPGRELRHVLTPSVINSIEGEILRMQNIFCEQLQKGRGDGMGRRLQEFGEILSKATWLHPSLSHGLRSILEIWPEKNDLESLFKLRDDVRLSSTDTSSPLLVMIDSYFREWLGGRGRVGDEEGSTVEALVYYWQGPPEPGRRSVALAVAQRSKITPELRIQCLTELKDLNRKFVSQLSLMLKKDTDMACVNFARLLASETWINPRAAECWHAILLSMIRQRDTTLLDHSVKYLKIESWFQWLNDLWEIFGDGVMLEPPGILNPSLHRWNRRLSERYKPILLKLESSMGSMGGLGPILIGWEDAENIIPMLNILRAPQDDPHEAGRAALIKMLAPDGGNLMQICQALLQLSRTSVTGGSAYQRVLEVREKSAESEPLAEAVLTVWLESPDLTPVDRSALTNMASILGLQTPPGGNPLQKRIRDVANHLEAEYLKLIDEASRIESLRLTLKAHDPSRTSAWLARNGIEDVSRVEDSYSRVPTELLDVVEGIGNGEFEMSFPLTNWKPLNLIANGLGSNARMLILRLALADGTAPPRFCMHIHPEPSDLGSSSDTREHSHHAVLPGVSAPDRHICHGRASRVTYQLCRTLHRDLLASSCSLESVYKSLTRSIDNLAHTCISCGRLFGPTLWRSVTCNNCSTILTTSDVEVRLVDLRFDPLVVDLLISSVYAAATVSPNTLSELLDGCPVRRVAPMQLALSGIPPLATLQSSRDLASSVRGLGSQTELLLSWLCNSYRGFLATATGALKIPSMPGVHQFVLANSAPELEETFARHMRQQQHSTVVFHGTSLDRLYAIIRQGLRVLSGGPLQRHGAALGSGVYASDELSTAFSYASGTSSSGWSASSFKNVRVLLACEVAGNPTSRNGVHVIADPSTIMVRYVFLFSAQARVPIAAHVVPGLTSAYAILRSRSG